MASPAEAAKRLALVIGNNACENVPQLQEAVNDADAIAAELSKPGFDVVKAENVGHRAMSRALVELEGKIAPGDTALVYFAGTASPSPSMCLLPTLARKGLSRTPPLLQTGFPCAHIRFSGVSLSLAVPECP